MRRRFFVSLVLAVAMVLAWVPMPAQGEIVCEEAIMIWSWAHLDWICSPSSGGGEVCTLCWDEMSVNPDIKN